MRAQVDLWSSAGSLGYIAVIATFICPTAFKLKKVLLACRLVAEASHTVRRPARERTNLDNS